MTRQLVVKIGEKNLIRHLHVGIKKGEIQESVNSVFKTLPEYQPVARRLIESSTRKEVNVETLDTYLDSVRKDGYFTKAIQEEVLIDMKQRNNNVFELASAITSVSQRHPDYRLKMDSYAGELLQAV